VLEKPSAMKKTTLSVYKRINILSFFFFFFAVLLFYKESGMIEFLMSDIVKFWDCSATLYFVPLFVLVIAIAPFLMRKKTGWLLLVIYLTYCTVFSIGLLYESLIWQPSEIPLIAYLFVQAYDPITCLILIAFFSWILWTISQKDMRKVYKVDKKSMLFIIGIVSILTVVIFWSTRHIYTV
jgi:hypothetical protein